MNELQKKYKEKIARELFTELECKSMMEVPKIVKIVINCGVNDAVSNNKAIDDVLDELGLITGQKPVVTKAKNSIASFKLREGMPIGVKVTLRSEKMFDFLNRLINVALPRVRDFHGVSNTAFDKQGNFTIGIKEQIIFPEIDYDKIKKVRGMDITIVTTAKTAAHSRALLAKMGMPFQK